MRLREGRSKVRSSNRPRALFCVSEITLRLILFTAFLQHDTMCARIEEAPGENSASCVPLFRFRPANHDGPAQNSVKCPR